VRAVYAADVPIPRLGELLGQDDAAAFLKSVVRQGRPANAYLFQGPAGVGKGTAALAFARALLCERVAGAMLPSADLFGSAAVPRPGTPPEDACGECPACHKSGLLQHPDLKFLFPVSGEERDLDATIAETLQGLREDPLFVFTYEKAASIRLSLTRELQRELAYEPFEAARRVVVVRDADRMREDQYSALLKTIEEPGASTVWVLTTSRPSRLPATIRSRCQRVRFAPLQEALARLFLEERARVSAREARILAALSGGNLARALALRDSEPLRVRDEALALLAPALRGDAAGLWRAAQGFMKYGRTGRDTLKRMFEIHQLWLRDLLRAQADFSPEALANRDREAEIRRVAATLTPREIRRRLAVLEEAIQSIDGNITADLTVFSTMVRVAGARVGEGRWPAHSTPRWDY
jgi:DNA polymerase-3 subunit delta'